jgi:hypothetical protein
VADPLMALAAPNPVAYHLTNMGAVNLAGKNSQTISPGIYTSITVSGQATLTLMPGIYVVAGGGLTVSGQATVNGSGVLIYNAGSNFVNNGAAGGTFGAITVSGQGNLNITPMKGGPYAGIVLFQSGYNSQSGINTQTLTLSGQSMLPGGGLVYAPAAQVNLSGGSVFSASVIASTLNVSGNATVQSVAPTSAARAPSAAPLHGVLAGGGHATIPLTRTGDNLAAVLSGWSRYGDTVANLAAIWARLQVTDNDTQANWLEAAEGLDRFWASYARDGIGGLPTDLGNG